MGKIDAASHLGAFTLTILDFPLSFRHSQRGESHHHLYGRRPHEGLLYRLFTLARIAASRPLISTYLRYALLGPHSFRARCSMRTYQPLSLLLFTILTFTRGPAQAITKVVDNGPDGQRLVFAVVGDAYKAEEQSKFATDVSNLLLGGMLAQDFYSAHANAFNVYRVDLTSHDSGVSTPTSVKNTALQVIFSGDWNRCWLEESSQTDDLINKALSSIAKYDFVLVMANEPNYGGCRRGSRLYVTSGDQWDVLAHEYGHAIGNLYDEYSADGVGAYTGPSFNNRNCSTTADRNLIIWRGLISADTPLPTTISANSDQQQLVGAFEGCSTYESHVYRPVYNCRMRSNTPVFCPVCRATMETAVAPYMAASLGAHLGPRSLGSGPRVGTRLGAAFRSQQRSPEQDPPATANSLPPQPYLSLVVRVKKDGSSDVIKSSLVSGPPILRQQATSNYVYALSQGKKTVSAEFLPENPFVIRGFADPNSKRGEKFGQTDEATIVVKVPPQQVKAIGTGKLSLQIFEIKPNKSPELLSNETMDALKLSKSLTTTIDISPKRLGTAVKDSAKQNSISVK